MQQRNVEIDIMKGITILCVMLGHTYWLPDMARTLIHSFHMPLFFLVSGFFAKTFSDFSGSNKDFLRKNAKQLLIPYLIVACVSCIYAFVQSIHYNEFTYVTHKLVRYFFALDHTWPDTIFDYWVDPIWFLLALFWARLFFFWLSHIGKWFPLISVILSIVMVFIHPYVPTPFCIGRGIEALVFLAIGYIYRHFTIPIGAKIAVIGCWFISMFLGKIDLCAFQFNCLPLDILGACGGTLVIYYLSKGIKLTFLASFFSWCGKNSLIILCSHTIESNMTIVHLATKALPLTIPQIIYFGIKHTITILGAWIFTISQKCLTQNPNTTYKL